MVISKKSVMAALIAGAMALGVRSAVADTITVTNVGTPVGGVFTYDINFSATSDLQSGDGFLITDFGAVVGTPSFVVHDGTPPPASDFTFSQPFGGSVSPTGLNGQTGSAPNTVIFTNGLSISTDIVDSDTVEDVVFIYNGPTITPGAGDLFLTLTSAETGPGLSATSLGVDHSGVAGSDISLAESTVLVPSPSPAGTPLPHSLLGGGLLLGLLAGYRIRKARLMA